MQDIFQKPSETFFVRKKALFRNAEKLNKLCACELFILIHNKATDKIFSYNSDPKFDLERVTSLIL